MPRQIKKHQPDRQDILWNTDWGIPEESLSHTEGKERRLLLYRGKWVEKKELRLLVKQVYIYELVRVLALSLFVAGGVILLGEALFWLKPLVGGDPERDFLHAVVSRKYWLERGMNIDAFHWTWCAAAILLSGCLILLGTGLWKFKRWAWIGTLLFLPLFLTACGGFYPWVRSLEASERQWIIATAVERMERTYGDLITPVLLEGPKSPQVKTGDWKEGHGKHRYRLAIWVNTYSDIFNAIFILSAMFSGILLLNRTSRTVFAKRQDSQPVLAPTPEASGSPPCESHGEGHLDPMGHRNNLCTEGPRQPTEPLEGSRDKISCVDCNASTALSRQGSPKTKQVIKAKDVVNDIETGMDDAGLMQKYGLSDRQLIAVYKKLEDAGLMKRR